MLFLLTPFGHARAPHSFPTRRSSDLEVPCDDADRFRPRPVVQKSPDAAGDFAGLGTGAGRLEPLHPWRFQAPGAGDRKSTRLNSSHSQISYAVFCLKKKKNNTTDELI